MKARINYSCMCQREATEKQNSENVQRDNIQRDKWVKMFKEIIFKEING